MSSPARPSFLGEAPAQRVPRARGERVFLIESDRGEQLKDSLIDAAFAPDPSPPAKPISRPLGSPLPSGGLGQDARLVVRGAAL